MTKTVCNICGKEMPTTKHVDKIEDLNFCMSSNGEIWDICIECREDLNRWMTIRRKGGIKMSYQPNVVNKGDVLIINGRRFEAKKDFNAQTDTVLKLRLVKNEKPKTIFAIDDEEQTLLNRIREGKGLPRIEK